MNQSELEAFVAGLPNVQREEAFGYSMYFVGADRVVAFVTFINTDQDYDHISNLNREGVYRVNIGVSRATFQALLGDPAAAAVDYTALNVFLPHPEYAAQHYVCILSPSGAHAEETKRLISEAHGLAAARAARKESKRT